MAKYLKFAESWMVTKNIRYCNYMCNPDLKIDIIGGGGGHRT